MSFTKQIKYKDSSGNEQIINIGVDAQNVENNTFSQAADRENIKSGEKLSTIFGKLMKWFVDLKNVAWTGSYNDLSDKPDIGSISGTVAVTQGGTGATTASQARINLGVGAAGTQGVANNCTTTAAGYLLDARQGKVLNDRYNQLSSNLQIYQPRLKNIVLHFPVVATQPSGGDTPFNNAGNDGFYANIICDYSSIAGQILTTSLIGILVNGSTSSGTILASMSFLENRIHTIIVLSKHVQTITASISVLYY